MMKDPSQLGPAAFQFDQACQLIAKSNEEIGLRLGEHTGRNPPSRYTVSDWRKEATDVPGWALIAAKQLARIVTTDVLPSGPAASAEPGSGQAHSVAMSAAAGGRRRDTRLYVLPGSLAAILAIALIMLVAATHSADPNVWWTETQQAVQRHLHHSTTPGSAALPIKPAGQATADPTPATEDDASLPDAPSETRPAPDVGHAQTGPPPMIALGVKPPPPEGIHTAPDPSGGAAGSARIGPISAGGAITDQGIEGCLGLTASAQLCGDVNSPIPLPLPPLPVPRIDPVVTPAS